MLGDYVKELSKVYENKGLKDTLKIFFKTFSNYITTELKSKKLDRTWKNMNSSYFYISRFYVEKNTGLPFSEITAYDLRMVQKGLELNFLCSVK